MPPYDTGSMAVGNRTPLTCYLSNCVGVMIWYKCLSRLVSSRPYYLLERSIYVLLVQFSSGFRVTRVKCCVRAEDVIGLDSKTYSSVS
jgi:hypothetical protein